MQIQVARGWEEADTAERMVRDNSYTTVRELGKGLEPRGLQCFVGGPVMESSSVNDGEMMWPVLIATSLPCA